METEAWILKITSKLLLSECCFSRKHVTSVDKLNLLFYQRVYDPLSTHSGCDSALVLFVSCLKPCGLWQSEEGKTNSQLFHFILFPICAYTEEGSFWLLRDEISKHLDPVQSFLGWSPLCSLNVAIPQSHWCFLYYLIKAESGSLSTLFRGQ